MRRACLEPSAGVRMLDQIIKNYAAALSANDRDMTLSIMAEAIAGGIKPEDLISRVFITPDELAGAQTRYLKGEFERGRFFLAMYEEAARLEDPEFRDFVLKGAAALTGSSEGFLYPVSDDKDAGGHAGRSGEVRAGRPAVGNAPGAAAARFICVPVKEAGRVTLALCVSGKKSEYDDYDLLQLQLTANEFQKARKRRRAREEEKERTDRTIRNQAALLRLVKTDFKDFPAALNELLETDSETLGVARVSFWSFTPGHAAIVCEDLCLGRGKSHEKGVTLQAASCPVYFRSLEEGIVIAADDARSDPRTREFTDGYLTPLGITSMMDAPVWLHGKMVGLVCHEHTGPAREWTSEDQAFAISVTDIISTAMETFERRKAEDGLRENEERWKFLLEGVQVIGFDWRYRYLNAAAAAHGRQAAEKLLGRTMMEVYPGIEKTEMFAKLAECMEKRVSQRMENEFVFKDGSAVWFELRMEPSPEGVIVLSHDITPRKQGEAALGESRQWLVLAQEIAGLGSWEHDAAGNRLTWSAGTYRIFGLQPHEFGGTYEAFLETVHPDDRAAVDAAYSGALRDNLGGCEIEHRMIHKATGEVRTVREKCFFLRNSLGKISRSIGMVQALPVR